MFRNVFWLSHTRTENWRRFVQTPGAQKNLLAGKWPVKYISAVADSVELLVRYHIGRCHLLSQNRKGEYAMDLVQPYRLIFEVNGDEIQIANILEIVDYH